MLDRGTKSSGGGYETLLSSRALSGAMKKLAAELTHQYLVTYSHPQSLIPPDSVAVAGTNPDYTVRGTLVRDAIEAQRR